MSKYAVYVIDFNKNPLNEQTINEILVQFREHFYGDADYDQDFELTYLINSIIGYTYNTMDGERLLAIIQLTLLNNFSHITYESVVTLDRNSNAVVPLNYVCRLLDNGNKFFELSLTNGTITLFYHYES